MYMTLYKLKHELCVQIPRFWAANPHMGTKPKDSPNQTSFLGLKLFLKVLGYVYLYKMYRERPHMKLGVSCVPK